MLCSALSGPACRPSLKWKCLKSSRPKLMTGGRSSKLDQDIALIWWLNGRVRHMGTRWTRRTEFAATCHCTPSQRCVRSQQHVYHIAEHSCMPSRSDAYSPGVSFRAEGCPNAGDYKFLLTLAEPVSQPDHGQHALTEIGTCCVQLHYWTQGEGRAHGLKEGEVLVSNHPQLAGGSHLPDITVITPRLRQRPHRLLRRVPRPPSGRGRHHPWLHAPQQSESGRGGGCHPSL